MGTKRDLKTLKALEQRRRLAAELLRRGVRPAEVARWVKTSRQSVMRWSRLLEQEGVRGLRRAARIGRPPVLDDRQLDQLARRLKAEALAAGYAARKWTLPRVGALIHREFGIRMAASSVWRTLQRMGWSMQHPARRTLQQHPAAVMQWKQTQGSVQKKTLPGKG